MEPTGNFKTYDKRHLFRMAGEDNTFTPGEKLLIAEWQGWKICPLVCYDLRFPVWSRNVFNKKTKEPAYDVLIYVANWPAARSNHWQVLLKARAIENLSYVVGVNRVGADGKGVAYNGNTEVISPTGELLYEAENAVETNTTVLSADSLQVWRSKFPAYFDGDDFELR